MAGDIHRIDLDRHLAHDLLDRAAVLHARGGSDQVNRHVHGDLLTGDELLKVDVQHLALERMALNLANERLGGATAKVELDDGRPRRDRAEQLLELARIEGERRGLAMVTVDDARDAKACAQLAGGTLAGLRACGRVEGCGCHATSPKESS